MLNDAYYMSKKSCPNLRCILAKCNRTSLLGCTVNYQYKFPEYDKGNFLSKRNSVEVIFNRINIGVVDLVNFSFASRIPSSTYVND